MSRTSEALTPLRVVIASPNDVLSERDAVQQIAENINGELLEEKGYILRVFRWETDSHPGFHPEGPQGIIDNIANIKECDILIGIFWKKFGTPIKDDGMTGTEHEIMEAYQAWIQSGHKKPQIMIYFNKAAFSPNSVEEGEQQVQVLKFKTRLPSEAFTWPYKTLDEFKDFFQKHLIKVVKELILLKEGQVSVPVRIVGSAHKPEKLSKFYGEKAIFIGRKDYLNKKIKEKIRNSGFRVSLVGPGGSGKSQLAFKALRQYYEKDEIIDLIVPVYLSPYSLIKQNPEGSMTVTTNITFRKFLNDIGFYMIKNKILSLTEQQFEELNVDNCMSTINDVFSESKHPVLYCDNFETISSILEEEKDNTEVRNIFNFLNEGLPSNTSLLVTSRIRRNFIVGENVVDVEGLAIDEGIELFIEYASVYRDHLENKKNTALQDLLKQIVTKTGGHPLSIEILASTYEGNGTTELDLISKTLGKERKVPFATEQRLQSLHYSLKFSIDKLDSSIQNLLPLLTIFHSPFPANAVKEIFATHEEQGDLTSDLYNKSLLMRIESDEYGQLDDRFWLYTIHPATRNYLEDQHTDHISHIQSDLEFIANFCNYYYSLVQKTYEAWGTENHTNFMRSFDLMSLSEGKNDFDKAIEFAAGFGSYDKEQEKQGKLIGADIATNLGNIYENLGQLDKSLLNHQKALEIHEGLNDRVGMAGDYSNIGLVYYDKGEYDQALTYHQKALEIHEGLSDRVGMAGDYSNIGLVYYNKGEYDETLTYHKKALEIHEGLNDRVGMAGDYSNIGLVYYDKGEYDQALTYHKKAFEIRAGLNDRVGMGRDYTNIGLVYNDKGEYDEALTYHQKAFEIRAGFNDRVGMGRDYTNIGLVYSNKGEYDEALTYHQKALEIDEGLNDRVGMALDYRNFGLVYSNKVEYDQALTYHQKALEIHEGLSDRVGMAGDYSNIGLVYYNKGEYDETLTYHKKALEIHEGLNDRVRMAGDYSNIGLVYYDKGEYDQALTYHKKAFEIRAGLNDRVGMGRDYTNIGLVYNDKGEYDQALTYHKKALEIDEGLNDKVNMAGDYSNIGLVYYDKGEYDQALTYHKKALEMHEQLNDRVGKVRVYCNIGYVYLNRKDIEKAKEAANNGLMITNEFEKDNDISHPLKNLVDELLSSINEFTG